MLLAMLQYFFKLVFITEKIYKNFKPMFTLIDCLKKIRERIRRRKSCRKIFIFCFVSFFSSIILGVFILVIAYTVMGSILFVSLEGDLEESDAIETAVAASKPYPRNNEANNAELRTR